MEKIAEIIRQEVILKNEPKRMKIKTLLKHFGYKKRSDDNTTMITEQLAEKGLALNPSLMRLGEQWEQTTEDWIYISERTQKPENNISKAHQYKLPENWNEDLWFDMIVTKEFRTEKEVETKFIIPLLSKLGYNENDRFDAMPVNAAHGSRKTTLEIDFALFDDSSEELNNQVLLVVEAKKEHRLIKQTQLENAQRQVKSYSVWLGCHFGLVTDSRTIQILDLMPHIGGMEIIFQCNRMELKDQFPILYNIIGKNRLKEYYLKLMS